MQGQFMDMKRLHSYLVKQIPSTLQRVSTSQIPLLSLVKKHNQMNQFKSKPLTVSVSMNTFIRNRGLSLKINQKLKNQTTEELDLSKYIILNEIGSGAYSTIYLTEEVESHTQYALKKLIIDEVELVSQIKNEIELVKYLSERNLHIVPFINFCINKLDATTHVIYLLMPLAQSDFTTKIRTQRNINLYNVLSELVDTLASMQREGICHRDIKPQNILYLENNLVQSRNFCLCDFDEVYKVPEDSTETLKLEVKGTELFMSPLVYNTFRYGVKYVIHNPFKSDVYSLGLCFVYVVTLSYDVLSSIRRNTDEENKALLTEHIENKNMVDILALMLKNEERDRLDFIELKEVLDSRGKR